MKKSALAVMLSIFVLMFAFGSYSGAKKAAFIDQLKCVKCGTCAKGCPVKAISKVEKEGKVSYLVDPVKCVACGTCVKNCPTKALGFVDPSAKKPDSAPASKTEVKDKPKAASPSPEKAEAPVEK